MIGPRSPLWTSPRLARALPYLACAAVVGALSLPLFQSMARDESGDYATHFEFAIETERSGAAVTESPGFTVMIIALSRLFWSAQRLLLAAVWISVLAMVAKFAISALMMEREVGPGAALIGALLLLFLAPITLDWPSPLSRSRSPVHYGQMSGLIFHNPTTVVAFPLVLLLFHYSYGERHVVAGVLAAAQCLIKPNFVVAWLPAFVVFQLWRHRFSWRPLAHSVVAVLPAVGVLSYQYATTERLGDGIVVAPFLAWSRASDNILWSCIRSLAFPVAFCVAWFREVRGRADHWLAWGILSVAFLQYALLYNPGAIYPGAWSWGRYPAIYIVFLLCLSRFLAIASRRDSWGGGWPAAANVLLIVLLALHFGSGLRYYLEGVWYARW